MKLTSSVSLLAWVLICAFQSALAPAGIIDQEHNPEITGGLGITNGSAIAQTFTVGLTGTLDQVDLRTGLNTNTPGYIAAPLVFEIRNTTVSGAPDTASGALRATIQLTSSELSAPYYTGAMKTIPLGGQSFAVTSGDKLALILTSTAPGDTSPIYVWGRNTSVPYTGGTVYSRTSSSAPYQTSSINNMLFRTYVAVPEPSALALLGVGALGLLRRSRRA